MCTWLKLGWVSNTCESNAYEMLSEPLSSRVSMLMMSARLR